jgi:hypothetical protein
MKQRELPVRLNVEVDIEGLRKVVREGRLLEFANAFAELAADNIKKDLVDTLASAGVGMTEVSDQVAFQLYFDVDDPYGTGPKPIPWPWPRDMQYLQDELRRAVREEMVVR